MAICSCGLPAHCCQPAVAGGFIYKDLRSELNTPLAQQACLLRVLCMSHCYKLYPFQAHWRRWHCTRFLRPLCLFTVHVGSGSSPLFCGVFLPPPLLQAFPLLIAGHVLLLLPAGVFVYSSHEYIKKLGRISAHHLLTYSFCVLAYYCIYLQETL
jgi:hypothetical protein